MFEIAAIANKAEQYDAMKSSFTDAGFDEGRCRYTIFDNSRENAHDPFRTLDFLASQAREPYIILCHQDVRADQGHGYDHLVQVIAQLDALHPHWALAGNAGMTRQRQLVRRIQDPYTETQPDWDTRALPQKVVTLDENFLLIKAQARLRPSPDLSGFHFYASDLCLHAFERGFEAYVIDFRLSHLSGGSFDDNLNAARAAFRDRWSREFSFHYYSSLTTTLFLSRHKILHSFFGRQRVTAWLSKYLLPL